MANGTQELSAPAVAAPQRRCTSDCEGRARTLAGLANVAVPLAIWFGPWGLDPRAQHALALMSFVLIGWMTHILEPAIIGLIGIYLAWALGVVPFPVAFARLLEHHAVVPVRRDAVRRDGDEVGPGAAAGLHRDAAHRRHVFATAARPHRLRFPPHAAGAIGRRARRDHGRGGPGHRRGVRRAARRAASRAACSSSLTYTATIFDKMLIAGAASITARGVIERAGQVEVLWSHWALAFLPVDLLTIVAAWRLAIWMYPPELITRLAAPASWTTNCGAWDRCRCRKRKPRR